MFLFVSFNSFNLFIYCFLNHFEIYLPSGYSPSPLSPLFFSKFTAQKTFKYGIFFWFFFYDIWTEYEDLRRKSRYSVQIRKNTDQKKLLIWTLFTQRLWRNNFYIFSSSCSWRPKRKTVLLAFSSSDSGKFLTAFVNAWLFSKA